jgi:simple sugar transport system substrate-binding protein
MGELDNLGDAVERLEWDERKEDDNPFKRWRQVTRRTALTGGAAGVAALALEACGGSSSKAGASGSAASGVFGSSGGYKFTFVNHVTTNTFFVPTQYGIADACKLLGCSYQWTGSQSSNVGEMVNAIQTAITAGVSGIATTLVDPTAFNAPVAKALSQGIPVVAYNADAAGNPRLSYIGQDLRLSGEQMGKRIASLVGSGDVALFIATPGSLNIQPRIDGAQASLKSVPAIKTSVIATGAAIPNELTTIQSYAQGHPNVKGMFAVDAGSTQGVAQTIQKLGLRSKGVKGGGYDLLTPTIDLLAAGQIDFTIDQQPYLQGFLPTLQLYMYKASQKLSGIAEVDTGLKFLDKTSVQPYATTKSRYEGSSTAAGVSKA